MSRKLAEAARWRARTQERSSSPVTVEGLALDSVLKRLGIDRVDLLKIDTKGAEGALEDSDVELKGGAEHREFTARNRLLHPQTI